jgi:hypothetical protein
MLSLCRSLLRRWRFRARTGLSYSGWRAAGAAWRSAGAGRAAQRYAVGECCQALGSRYDVAIGSMRTILKRAGVALRDRKAAALMRKQRDRPGPEPPESTSSARAAIPAGRGRRGEMTAISADVRSLQLNFRL